MIYLSRVNLGGWWPHGCQRHYDIFLARFIAAPIHRVLVVVEKLVNVLCVEAIAPKDFYVVDIGPLVLPSRIVCFMITRKSNLEDALAWLQALALCPMPNKLPVRFLFITAKVYRLLRVRVEPSCMHIVDLHDPLKRHLLGVVVVGRVVKKLSFDAVILGVFTIVILEKPGHLDNAVVEV